MFLSFFFLSSSFVASRLTSPNAPRLGTLSDQRPSVGAVAGTPCYVWLTRSKCIASSNKCLTSSNKKLLVNSCFGRVFVSTVFTPSEQLKGENEKGEKGRLLKDVCEVLKVVPKVSIKRNWQPRIEGLSWHRY